MNIHSVAKYQKNDGGSFGAIKKFRKKNLNSLSAEKKGKVAVSKKVERGHFCFGMAFYLMLEALDALKMKY